MVNINIEIPTELHKKIKIYCAMNDLTLKEFIISTLSQNIDLNKIRKRIKINNNG